MFNKEEKAVQNILEIKIENGKLCSKKLNSYILEIEGLDFEKNMYDGFWINNQWFLTGLDSSFYTLDSVNKIKMILEKREIHILDRESGYLCLVQGRENFEQESSLGYKFSLFDTNEFKEIIVGHTNGFPRILKKDILYTSTAKNNILQATQDIFKINGVKNEILWTLNMELFGLWYNELNKNWDSYEAWNFIGVVNDILWIDIYPKKLIGIDVAKGHLKYQFDKGTCQLGNGDELPYFGKTTYEKRSHKLVGFYASQYWEIDLKSPFLELKIWNLNALMNEYSATFPNFEVSGLTEKYIYFAVGCIGTIPQIIALNRQNFKIDWRFTFGNDIPYFSPTNVKVNDNQLFVLDNQNYLHIFDKCDNYN